MTPASKIGAVVYDLRASGVVRNLLRIAERARGDGLEFEIWPLRAQGEFLGQARDTTRVNPILPVPVDALRDLDSLLHHDALSEALGKRGPALVFSAGNQMHWHLAKALQKLPTDVRPRVVGRASNAVVSLGDANPLFRAVIKPQEKFQFQAMNHVVAVSNELRNQLVGGLGLEAGRVACIPNGIDVDRFSGALDGAAENERPVILGLGRLSKQKDFSTLIDAVAKLQTLPKPTLRILGRGTDAWKARLKSHADSKGIGDQLDLLGHVDDVATHLRRADLFVSSSRWEGASNVVLEALACGTPIVATKAPTGIEEVLLPLDRNILVPVGDPGALARAIERRLGQPRASETLIQRARDFDLSSTLDSYSRMFAEQLSLAERPSHPSAGTPTAHLQYN